MNPSNGSSRSDCHKRRNSDPASSTCGTWNSITTTLKCEEDNALLANICTTDGSCTSSSTSRACSPIVNSGGELRIIEPLERLKKNSGGTHRRRFSGSKVSNDVTREISTRRYFTIEIPGIETTLTSRKRNGSKKTYTGFVIVVSDGASQWTVFRRYSQFRKLRHLLLAVKDRHTAGIPNLPPKDYMFMKRLFPSFLEERRVKLQSWLIEILLLEAVSSDPRVLSFLGDERQHHRSGAALGLGSADDSNLPAVYTSLTSFEWSYRTPRAHSRNEPVKAVGGVGRFLKGLLCWGSRA